MVFDSIAWSLGGCAFLAACRLDLTSDFSNLTTILTQRHPVDPSRSLPEDLVDLHPTPFKVPPNLRVVERRTYYWLYRQIQNLYKYFEEYPRGGPLLPPPPGWSRQQVHLKRETLARPDARFVVSPMAVSVFQEERRLLVVAIRGTVMTEEWAHDFHYHYAGAEAQATFPGRVHQVTHLSVPLLLSRASPPATLTTARASKADRCTLPSY